MSDVDSRLDEAVRLLESKAEVMSLLDRLVDAWDPSTGSLVTALNSVLEEAADLARKVRGR